MLWVLFIRPRPPSIIFGFRLLAVTGRSFTSSSSAGRSLVQVAGFRLTSGASDGMSAEEAVTDARQAPLEQNAQSAEEVKKMLAELQDQSEASGQTKETNGTSATVPAADKVHSEENVPEKDRESATAEQGSSVQAKDAADKPRARRQEGRSDRGSGRPGRGRGGYQARNYRDNIKSDLTAQEESSDPVAIRKQV